MRRVLVPLDGTPLAETVLPDARRLAGGGGSLILIQDIPASPVGAGPGAVAPEKHAEVDTYLQRVAGELRGDGALVEVHTMTVASVALAIDQAATLYQADMIAVATHGNGPLGRILHGRTAWRALARSPVPVLLRGPRDSVPAHVDRRKIMVPLDGSPFGESALPLAESMAQEWHAPLWLVLAIETSPHLQRETSLSIPDILAEELAASREYLAEKERELTVETHTRTLISGQVAPALTDVAGEIGITDVVLASHGRTGLPRVIMGSVADGLIQRLSCPIVVIPASALAHGWSESRDHSHAEPVLAGCP
jgi:nucleotide-binding universal stress UspA family protein